MRKATVLALALVSCSFTVAQSKPAPAQKTAPRQTTPTGNDALQKMLQDAKPGPIHKALMQRAGDYTHTTRLLQDGKQQGKETVDNARFVPIIGGRFLMEGDGGTGNQTNFSSFRLWGYNNGAKHYEAVWSYDRSTAMTFMSGTASEDGKTVTYKAGWQKSQTETERITVTVTQVNPDKFIVRMISAAGEKGPVLEETYERVKKK